ncbi:MAG: rod shape-determining protein MreD [Flavicella sp.]
MNREILNIYIRFIVLILIQVLIANHINLFGYLNPMLYIVFIFLYPTKLNRGNFLFVVFLMGLMIDLFSNSGGINAAASLLIAYLRLPILHLIFNKQELDYQTFDIKKESIFKVAIFVTLLTFVHHIAIFSLEYWNWEMLQIILRKSTYTSIITIVLSILTMTFISNSKTNFNS